MTNRKPKNSLRGTEAVRSTFDSGVAPVLRRATRLDKKLRICLVLVKDYSEALRGVGTLGTIETLTSKNGELLAILIRKDYRSKAAEFLTPKDCTQQLGILRYPKGHSVAPHLHNAIPRTIQTTQEVVIVRSGKVRLNLFTSDKKHHSAHELSTGDIAFLASGGHGFDILEETELIDIKQGPYSSVEADKERFHETR